MFTVEFVTNGTPYGKTECDSFKSAREIVNKLKIDNLHWDLVSNGVFHVFNKKGIVARVINVGIVGDDDPSDDELLGE